MVAVRYAKLAIGSLVATPIYLSLLNHFRVPTKRAFDFGLTRVRGSHFCLSRLAEVIIKQ